MITHAAGSEKGNDKKWRRADTNVVAIRFDQLTSPSKMHTGDAVSCQRCHAIMSHLSTINDAEADKKVSVGAYTMSSEFERDIAICRPKSRRRKSVNTRPRRLAELQHAV